MAILLPRPAPVAVGRRVCTIKLKDTYLGFHTPLLGKRLTADSVTEGSVLGFDDRRDALRMAARLVEHKRAVRRWPSRVFDPRDGFGLAQDIPEGLEHDIGELKVVEESFGPLQRRLALAGIALRTIARTCSHDEGGLHSTVHKLHVDLADMQRQLDSLLAKGCPEHF